MFIFLINDMEHSTKLDVLVLRLYETVCVHQTTMLFMNIHVRTCTFMWLTCLCTCSRNCKVLILLLCQSRESEPDSSDQSQIARTVNVGRCVHLADSTYQSSLQQRCLLNVYLFGPSPILTYCTASGDLSVIRELVLVQSRKSKLRFVRLLCAVY